MMSIDEIERLHRRYAPNRAVYDLVFTHCRIVAEIARWCVQRNRLSVDAEALRSACLLHDIGTYVFFDDVGRVANQRLYMQHALLGAQLLRDEGCDERIVAMVESHVLMGLTKQESITHELPLPHRDYEPASLEAEVLCYADRFHSKLPIFNTYDSLLTRLQDSLPNQAVKFRQAAERFGVPDIAALAATYNHPQA